MELSGIIVNCTVLSQYVVNDIKIESLLQGIFRLSPTVLLSVWFFYNSVNIYVRWAWSGILPMRLVFTRSSIASAVSGASWQCWYWVEITEHAVFTVRWLRDFRFLRPNVEPQFAGSPRPGSPRARVLNETGVAKTIDVINVCCWWGKRVYKRWLFIQRLLNIKIVYW